MPLKDRISRDNKKIFMNHDHFARVHTWNGEKFTCVQDDTKSNGIQFGKATEIIIFVEDKNLPCRAQPDEFIIFDDVQMRITNVIDAKGMKEIHLTGI